MKKNNEENLNAMILGGNYLYNQINFEFLQEIDKLINL